MFRTPYLAILSLAVLPAFADDSDVVFRSDVSLVRVDVQVVDRDNRAITGLRAEDFVLREEGRPQQIRNFAREDMPLDVLFLFDVSASMRPHVERIAAAAHDAFRVLGDNDREAIMVFDRSTRVRLPFRTSRSEVEREMENMLRQESFHGGTDITRGLLDAADYIRRQGRRDARRAIVILTDDQTEFDRDEVRVERALERADAVLSALIAPDAMRSRPYSSGGSGRRSAGSGVGMGGPLGGIILGRRGGYGGGRPQGRGGNGGYGGPHTASAGTSEIARESGGDSLPVDDASALETTLSRIRQRYALHFLLPPGVTPGEERNIDVALADRAVRRYPEAELRFRRVYMTPGSANSSAASVGPPVVRRAPAASTASSSASDDPVVIAPSPAPRRRGAISEPDAPHGPNPALGGDSKDAAQPPPIPASSDASGQPAHGWRKVKPDEPPR